MCSSMNIIQCHLCFAGSIINEGRQCCHSWTSCWPYCTSWRCSCWCSSCVLIVTATCSVQALSNLAHMPCPVVGWQNRLLLQPLLQSLRSCGKRLWTALKHKCYSVCLLPNSCYHEDACKKHLLPLKLLPMHSQGAHTAASCIPAIYFICVAWLGVPFVGVCCLTIFTAQA